MAKYFIQAETCDFSSIRFCVKAVSFDNAVDKAERFLHNVRWFEWVNIGVRLDGAEYDIPENWKPVSVAKGIGDTIENIHR